MRDIKRALDPDNRMNPGKVLRLTDWRSASSSTHRANCMRPLSKLATRCAPRPCRRVAPRQSGASGAARSDASTRRTGATDDPARRQGCAKCPTTGSVERRSAGAVDSRRLHVDLQRQGPDRLARQHDRAPRRSTGLPRRARHDSRHPAPARQRRPAHHRQEVPQLRVLHGGEAGLGQRQRRVLPHDGNRRWPTRSRMDYLPGGSMGRFISEGGFQFGAGRGAAPAAAPPRRPDARGCAASQAGPGAIATTPA